jgi:hypothetical protein
LAVFASCEVWAVFASCLFGPTAEGWPVEPGRARGLSEEGLLKLAELMRSKDAAPSIVIAAIDRLLDRGMGKPVPATGVEPPMLEKPRTGDDAKDITPERPVIIEEDPLYASYVAWGRALKEPTNGVKK